MQSSIDEELVDYIDRKVEEKTSELQLKYDQLQLELASLQLQTTKIERKCEFFHF